MSFSKQLRVLRSTYGKALAQGLEAWARAFIDQQLSRAQWFRGKALQPGLTKGMRASLDRTAWAALNAALDLLRHFLMERGQARSR